MKLSVFLPTIRTHLLPEFCDFLRRSYSGDLEVVLAGPFEPETSLLNKWQDNGLDWTFIQTYQSPTCAAQQAALSCRGDLVLHSVDDTLYLPEALDELVESHLRLEACTITGDGAIITNAPYCDSPDGYRELQKDKIIRPDKFAHPDHYWTAVNAGYGGIPNIEPSWMTTCHFLMRKAAFIEFGGFDCQFEYLNHACHDLLYRMYLDGYCGISLNETVSLADWIPNRQGDHGPIHDAQLSHDHPLFIKKWGGSVFSPSVVPALKIDPLNYKNHPAVWERRFNKGGQKEYGELGYA